MLNVYVVKEGSASKSVWNGVYCREYDTVTCFKEGLVSPSLFHT